MLSVELDEIVKAEVIPWEDDVFGVAYTTKDGRKGSDRIGARSEAEAVVRRVAMTQEATEIFPKDIAAS